MIRYLRIFQIFCKGLTVEFDKTLWNQGSDHLAPLCIVPVDSKQIILEVFEHTLFLFENICFILFLNWSQKASGTVRNHLKTFNKQQHINGPPITILTFPLPALYK